MEIDVPCSWIQTCNAIVMPVFPQFIYTFKEVLIKIPEDFFLFVGNAASGSWKDKGSRIAKQS